MRKVGVFDKYGSDIEFEESEDSIKAESLNAKYFFPLINIYFIVIFLIFLLIASVLMFYLTIRGLLYWGLGILLVFLPVCALQDKALKKKNTILINIISKGIHISLKENPNKVFFINSSNIEDIYPHFEIIQDGEGRSSIRYPSFSIVVKLKNPISSGHFKGRDCFRLFDFIHVHKYNVFKLKIRKMKKILNLSENVLNANNFNYEDLIIFSREQGKIKILSKLSMSFFKSKSEEDINDFVSSKFFIFFGVLIFLVLSVMLLKISVYLCLVAFLLLIFIPKIKEYLLEEIIFTISSNGINIKYRKYNLFIKKEEIESIKCINDIDKDETENVIEKRPEEPNYYKIILKTKSPIFLKLVADLEKDRFSLFGNIDKEWKDIAFLLKRELQEMLNY